MSQKSAAGYRLTLQDALIATALLAIIAWAYQGAMGLYFRNDDWLWLYETRAYRDNFWAHVANFYSYPRQATVIPKFMGVFRPGLHVLLPVYYLLFGLNYQFYAGVNLALQAISAGALFFVFRTFLAAPFASALALLYAVNMVSVEVALWPHLSGYIVFQILFFAVLFRLQTKVPAPKSVDHTVVILAFLSMLFNELGVAICFAVLLLSLRQHQRNQAFVTVCAMLLYLALYIADWFAHSGPTSLGEYGQFDLANVLRALTNVPMLLGHYLSVAFFPSLYDAVLVSDRFGPLTLRFNGDFSLSAAASGLALIMLLALPLVGMSCGRRVLDGLFWSPLFFVSFLTLVGAIVLLAARSTAGYGGMEAMLKARAYHGYFLWPSILMMAAVVAERGTKKVAKHHRVIATTAVAVSLLAFCYTQTEATMRVVADSVERMQPIREYVRAVDTFVVAHKDESDFSFAPDPAERIFRPDPSIYYTLSECLWPRYVDRMKPKYQVRWDQQQHELDVAKVE